MRWSTITPLGVGFDQPNDDPLVGDRGHPIVCLLVDKRKETDVKLTNLACVIMKEREGEREGRRGRKRKKRKGERGVVIRET